MQLKFNDYVICKNYLTTFSRGCIYIFSDYSYIFSDYNKCSLIFIYVFDDQIFNFSCFENNWKDLRETAKILVLLKRLKSLIIKIYFLVLLLLNTEFYFLFNKNKSIKTKICVKIRFDFINMKRIINCYIYEGGD